MRGFVLVGACSAIMANVPALAQQDGLDEAMISDIVVTAQKRAESGQRIPAAITAISGDSLAEIGIVDQTQLGKVVPGLVIGDQSGNGLFFLRGVGQTQGSPNVQPGVSVNVNGVYAPREMGVSPLFDLERVEVLPGPQGTLYGRNAAGGAINFITKRPRLDRLSADFTLEAGNYSLVHPTFVVNVPLTGSMAIRMAGERTSRRGYFTNGSNDRDQWAGRISLLAEPNPDVSIFLSGGYVRDSGIGDNQISYVEALNRDDDLYDQTFSTDGYFNDGKVYTFQGELRFGIDDNLDLVYVPGFVDVKHYQNTIFNGISSLFTNKARQYSQEARLDYNGDVIDFIVGAYWYKSHHILAALVGSPPFPVPAVNVAFDNKINGHAVYGDLTYRLSPEFRVTLGGRLSRDKFDGFFAQEFFAPLFPPAELLFTGRKAKSHIDYKVGLQYDLTPRSMAYFTVQSGYLMGGYASNGAVGNLVPAETLTAYTGGIKNRLFGGHVIANLEGFYYDYRNYQLQYTQGVNFLVTTAPARIYGAELSLIGEFGNTRLSLNALAESAKIRSSDSQLFDRDGVQQSIRGFALPNAPSLTISAGLRQRFPLANGAEIIADGQIYYNSGYWMQFTHDLNTYQDNFTTTDLSLTYQGADNQWSVGVFVRNLEDEAVLIGANKPDPALGPSSPFVKPPRTFGGRFEMHF